MMQSRTTGKRERRDKCAREVVQALKATGLPWQRERLSKHYAYYLDGQLVGIAGQNGSDRGHDAKQLLARIKQIIDRRTAKA